jgi:GTP cyclohydrolase I
MDIRNFDRILKDLCSYLNAGSAHIDVTFPYFMEKEAPVSHEKSMMEYRCKFSGSMTNDGDRDFYVTVEVPVTSVCPCSKEISSKGAHNQRSVVRVTFRSTRFIWIEDIIKIVEECASAPVYSLLKREDEKYLTELAYDRPRFVEDSVREVGKRLKANSNIYWFTVESENFESIHNHSAYAFIQYGKRTKGRRKT